MTFRFKLFTAVAIGLTLAAGTSSSGSAQEGEPDAAEPQLRARGDVVTYEPAFFTRYNPQTALDMVRQVPGFSFDGGDNVRGFGGAAGNVLINGERPSAKTDLSTILERIPANAVERIEHVRGSAAGIDMRGQSEVVNVIRARGAAGEGSFEGQLKAWESSPITFAGNVAYAGQLAGWRYSANLQRFSNTQTFGGTERLFDTGGALIEARHENFYSDERNWNGGFEATREFGANTLRLNAQARDFTWAGREPSFVFGPAHEPIRFGNSHLGLDGYVYELGGDIERELSSRWSVKLIGLNSVGHDEADNEFETRFLDGTSRLVFQNSGSDRGESILRSFATWTPAERHSLEMGVEGAYNYLDTGFGLRIEDDSGVSVLDIPVSNTKVEEYRGEVFASWVWRQSESLTIEPGLVVEYSEIEQSGEGANARNFTYFKPKLNTAWAFTENQQLTLLIERAVGQLNFSDFASSVSINEDTTLIGNPTLEPDKTWLVEAEWERSFWNDGVVSLTGRYEYIQDVIDFVPVTTVNGNRFDAIGNIGDGRRLLATLQWRIPTDNLGVDNATLEGNFNLQDTSVTDPVTGEDRRLRFRGDHWWRIDFRKDHPATGVSWGFDYAKSSPFEFFRLEEIQTIEGGHGDFDIFVETTRYLGLTFRVDVENIFNQTHYRRRDFFDAPRDVGMLDRFEIREKNNGFLASFTVRGNF